MSGSHPALEAPSPGRRAVAGALWPPRHDGLAALLAAAAALDLDDAEAVSRLRAAAQRATARAAASARLPRHLIVGPDDPGVVVVRTLAAATRALGTAAHPGATATVPAGTPPRRAEEVARR